MTCRDAFEWPRPAGLFKCSWQNTNTSTKAYLQMHEYKHIDKDIHIHTHEYKYTDDLSGGLEWPRPAGLFQRSRGRTIKPHSVLHLRLCDYRNHYQKQIQIQIDRILNKNTI